MAEPKAWRILKAFKEAVDLVLVVNGYNYDLNVIYRPPVILEGSNPYVHKNAIVYIDGISEDDGAEPSMHDAWILTIAVDVIWIPDATELTTVPNDQVLMRLWNDVTKAVHVDSQLGGEAVDIHTRAADLFDIEGSNLQGVTCRYNIMYRNLVTNPESPEI